MKRFEQVKIKDTKSIVIEGMEISAYISGVNSGVYELPFVIEVRAWCKKWIFKKFFRREMKLNIYQVEMLRDECNKVLEYYKNRHTSTNT